MGWLLAVLRLSGLFRETFSMVQPGAAGLDILGQDMVTQFEWLLPLLKPRASSVLLSCWDLS